jgi:hypothetical protein
MPVPGQAAAPLPPLQTIYSSQKAILGSLDVFFKTTTEACSGVSYGTYRDEICSELQAQQTYVEEILLTRKKTRGLSEDVRKAKACSTITQLLEAFEKAWADSHREVTVPTIANVIHRQFAYLALDVAIKSGDVTSRDKPNMLMHIAAVQREAMSRQLVILKAITQSLKKEALSNRRVAAPFREQETELLPSGSPPLKRLPPIVGGSFRPSAQKIALVIDEDTGVASVVQFGDLGDATTHGPQVTLKRKQEAENRTSCQRPRTGNAQNTVDTVAMLEPFVNVQSPSQSTTRAGFCTPPSNMEYFRDEADVGAGSNGTVVPAKLVRTAPVWSSTTTFRGVLTKAHTPISHTNISGLNGRGYMDVAESFRSHGYNLVSEEQRMEELLRHREANQALLGEKSPPLDAGTDSGATGVPCYVETAEFDSFGFGDEPELPGEWHSWT